MFQKRPNRPFNALDAALRFANLRTFIGGIVGKKWWRPGSPEEDEVVAHAAHELIEGVMDADGVNKIQDGVGVNLRDQVTVEEIEDWDKDRRLRGFGNQRN